MSEYEVIPDKAITILKDDPSPERREAFDQVFGAGAAEEALKPKRGVLGTVGDVLSGVPYGVQEATNEGLDTVESFNEWAGAWLDSKGIPSVLSITDGEGNLDIGLKYWHEVQGEQSLLGGKIGEKGDALELNVVDQPETTTGNIVGGISQFAAGYVGVSKFTKLAGLKGAFVNGAIVDAFLFDPEDPNITKTLEGFGVNMGAFGDVMANDPDDPEWINRLRNTADGALGGAVVEAFGWTFKALKAHRMGDTKTAKEFFKKADEATQVIDGELEDTLKSLTDDAVDTVQTTPELVEKMKAKVDAEGQIEMDLGDTPAKPSVNDLENLPQKAIPFVTPERAEAIRYQTKLASKASLAEQQKGLSYRSPTTAKSLDEVMNWMAGTREVYAKEFANMKGGVGQTVKQWQVQANKTLKEFAHMTGEDKDVLIDRFFSGFTTPEKMAAELKAREDYVYNLGLEMQQISKAVSGEIGLDQTSFKSMAEARAALHLNMQMFANLTGAVDSARSNVARAMRAMQMSKSPDKRIREMLEDPSLMGDVDALAKALAKGDASDPKTILDAVKSLSGVRKAGDAINHFRINALLSGPGTQLVNITSNAVYGLALPAQELVGGALTGSGKRMKHAMQTYRGMILGAKEAVKTSLKAYWEDTPLLDLTGKVDGEDLRMDNFFGPADKVISQPTRVLMMFDEFFKQAQYRGHIFANADELASAKGLKGAEREAFIKDYIQNSFDENGLATRGDALLQAQRATFTEHLNGNVMPGIQKVIASNPLLRFIAPFVRTPVNLLSTTAQHMPAAGIVLSRRLRDDLAAGGIRRAQAIGKQAMGLSMILWAADMVASGRLTGSGPADPEMRKAWLAAGNKPYSIKFGPNEDGSYTWLDISRLEPLSTVMVLSADIAEIYRDEYDDFETDSMMMALFLATAENTVNKTFTQGIADFMDILDSQDPRSAERAMRSMAASFVPNLVNQLNGDEAYREVRSLADEFRKRDFRFDKLDPKRNILGEIQWRDLPKWLPVGTVTKDHDPIMAEISRLSIKDRTISTHPNSTIRVSDDLTGELVKKDLRDIEYRPGQSMYDKWLQETGEVKIRGKTLREKLEEVISSEGYKLAAEDIIGGGKGTKSAIISKVISTYRQKARANIPELRELLIKSEQDGRRAIRDSRQENRKELFPDAGGFEVDPDILRNLMAPAD